MDGRTQIPVNEYLKKRFKAEHVDTITEPGPNAILADRLKPYLLESIFDRLHISVDKHGSNGIGIVGHHDCAGNPTPYEKQIEHLKKAVELVKGRYNRCEVIALWVDENWEVHEVSFR
jgi:hypothetical protein